MEKLIQTDKKACRDSALCMLGHNGLWIPSPPLGTYIVKVRFFGAFFFSFFFLKGC
ncbi:hypothetical protein [Flavobacterium hungaricum]|uniref:hypothetical protein n=1 Tax=Flavobacterium hungaricum TaxID=2082725 RepID=UPI001883160C|nr:hypothetical protein [Flavobacterium hungaricum]